MSSAWACVVCTTSVLHQPASCEEKQINHDTGSQSHSTPVSQASLPAEDLDALHSDNLTIDLAGGVMNEGGGDGGLEELLHCRDHFDDINDPNMLRWRKGGVLLRKLMCDRIGEMGMKHPMPQKWHNKPSCNRT